MPFTQNCSWAWTAIAIGSNANSTIAIRCR